MKTLSPLQTIVAEKLHNCISEQDRFIAYTKNVVQKQMLGENLNSFSLRQNVQALETGNTTKDALLKHFNEYVECTHAEYVESISIPTVNPSVESRLVSIIKELCRLG
jgi:hypothetical protein